MRTVNKAIDDDKENNNNDKNTPSKKNKNIIYESKRKSSNRKLNKKRSPTRISPTSESMDSNHQQQAESLEFLKRSRDGYMPEELGAGLWSRRR